MKRRNFIGTSGLFAMSALVSGCSSDRKNHGKEYQDSNSEGLNTLLIAGHTPRELLKKYKQFLFDDFLPFMDKHIVDHEYGGFMCNADRNGNQINPNKSAWYDGRGLWIYSKLYNSFGRDPAWLEIAGKTTDLVLKIRPDNEKFWPGTYTREGLTLNNTISDIYGNLFIAEGLAEYSKATDNEKYWAIAKEIIMSCFRVYDQNNYQYMIYYGPKIPDINGPRVVGHWMVFLKATSVILQIKPDNDLEVIYGRCLDALMNHHFITDFNLMIEVLAHDMTKPEGPFSQFAYLGHAIEVLWMVMAEAVRKKDKNLFNLASERFKRHVEVAWDDVYGGVFRCLENVDANIWKVDKVLWEQEEVLIGTLFMIEHSGDPWAFKWFEKTFNYVMDTFPLKKHGYPLWDNGGDRKMTFDKESNRIENYHHPRHLILNIQSLERIINAGGKVIPV